MTNLAALVGLFLLALAAAGCVYQLAALVMVRGFLGRQSLRAAATDGVTLLKPLHGAEPQLAANLASFLAQDIVGPIQLVCGVGDRSDPATETVAQLQREHPGADIELIANTARHGANAKVGNLINMTPAARHGALVLSDSDMAVPPHYLGVVLAALAQPGVGAVTCLYRGRGDAGFWSRLSAGAISYIALPATVVGYRGGMARPCMGSTIALRRETLQAIGGFARFADVLADDYAIGESVAAIGKRVEIPPMVLVHGCSETGFAALWRQKLRWSATIRSVAPLRHAGSIVTYPLPLALLAALFLPVSGLALAAASLLVRLAIAVTVDHRTRSRSAPLWWLPAIESGEFLTFLASFAAHKIDWRGSRLTMQRDGRIAA
jgi:ceramide glucosyltransferase